MATSLVSFPLLDNFPATWLEVEKQRWLDEDLIGFEDYDLIPCESGLLQHLAPGSSTAANSQRDQSIVPDGYDFPSLLVMARLRTEREIMLEEIRGAFGTCSGELRKVISFVWDILPGNEAALDVEVYEYEIASGRERLAQKVRIFPSEQDLGTLELRVTYGDVFAAYPPTGRVPEDIIRIPLFDLSTSAEEVVAASELLPASTDSYPEPVEQLVHSHVEHAEEHHSSIRVTKHEEVHEEMFASDYLNVHFNSTRKISAMYPEDDPRIEEMAMSSYRHSRTVAAEMSLTTSKENLLRIAKLAPYDVVVYGDDSGSMRTDGRYNSLRTLVYRFIPAATRICGTGISMRFINSSHDSDLNNIRETSEIDGAFQRTKPRGATPIGTRLREKIIFPFLRQLSNPHVGPFRPKLVVVITDGEPTREDPNALRDAIIDCKTELNTLLNQRDREFGDASIAFMLSVIGDADEARRFMNDISEDRRISDMVFCNRERIEAQMSVPVESERSLTLLSLLGATIDKTEFSPLRGGRSR